MVFDEIPIPCSFDSLEHEISSSIVALAIAFPGDEVTQRWIDERHLLDRCLLHCDQSFYGPVSSKYTCPPRPSAIVLTK